MTAIDEIVYLLDEAFSGTGIEETNEGQSLLMNLGTVEDSRWHAVPPGGVRTIASVALRDDDLGAPRMVELGRGQGDSLADQDPHRARHVPGG